MLRLRQIACALIDTIPGESPANRKRSWEWSRGRATEAKHLAATLGLLQIIGPVLHHLGARLQVQRMVVGRADSIARRVGKLQLDMLMRVPLLMQNGRCQDSEAMARHLP